MRYETMGRNRTQRLDVPQLLGGVNTAADAALIDDDELAAVCNLTAKNGALVTRGAVRAIGETPLYAQANKYRQADVVLRQPIEIGGKMCTVIVSAALHITSGVGPATVQVVSLDDGAIREYVLENASLGVGFVVVPYDENIYRGGFLLYHALNVYVPNNDNGTMEQVSEDKLYAPLVMTNGTSVQLEESTMPSTEMANGVMYEGFNLMTNRYRAQFTPSVEGDAEYYILPSRLQKEPLEMTIITAYGEMSVSMTPGEDPKEFQIGMTHYTAQAFTDGYVCVSPALPVSTISDTVTITCMREGTLTNDIHRATRSAWFGGTRNKRGGTRLFLAGFSDEKAKLMWSDVNDPFYFPENNYIYVGDLSQKITALEKQGDMLVIFKERELFYTTYVQGEIDAEAVAEGINVDVTVSQAYFPLTQLSPSIGCRCPNSIALCRDRLVWMDSDARIYTLAITGTYSERNVREIGQKMRPFLLENTTESERKIASAIDHKGKYRVMTGTYMAEFDYNDSGFVNVSSYSSGERAARNIAWFVHRFGGFTDGARQVLVSDGADTALLISTTAVDGYPIVRMLYAFDVDEASDRYVAFDGVLQANVSEQPIAVTLTTKTYELGDPAAYKRIGAFFPMMKAEDAMLYFIADGTEPPYGREYRSDDLHAHLVLPAIKRCRSLAVRMEATGRLCIKGLRLQYSMFGAVK